jgi:Hemerythrin HHE cation binding domain
VDSVTPDHIATALVKTGPVVSDAGNSEISELIFAEHARILRLFGALDGVVRRGEPAVTRLALDQIWTRLASLLEVHCMAEEEVCFPLMLGSGALAQSFVEEATADHDDLRAAVAEARLLEVGSSRWWQVIVTARAICTQHFASEERGPLAQACRSVPPETSKILVRRWTAFAAGHADGTP